MKVLFLDIDGVVLPRRAYFLPNQTRPLVKMFDPCAVALLNDACTSQKRQIVLHSSWIRTLYWDNTKDGDVVGHCIEQGIQSDLFHSDPYCGRDIHWRYDRVEEWLLRHEEVDDFVIVDDEPLPKLENLEPQHPNLEGHLLQTDFDEGLTMAIYRQLFDRKFPR